MQREIGRFETRDESGKVVILVKLAVETDVSTQGSTRRDVHKESVYREADRGIRALDVMPLGEGKYRLSDGRVTTEITSTQDG